MKTLSYVMLVLYGCGKHVRCSDGDGVWMSEIVDDAWVDPASNLVILEGSEHYEAVGGECYINAAISTCRTKEKKCPPTAKLKERRES